MQVQLGVVCAVLRLLLYDISYWMVALNNPSTLHETEGEVEEGALYDDGSAGAVKGRTCIAAIVDERLAWGTPNFAI